MKSTITINLDIEIVKLLKAEKNYSDLINEQIKGYYDVKLIESTEFLNQKLAEIKQNLKENRKKKRDVEEMLNKIDKKDRKIKTFLKKRGLTRQKLIQQITKRRDLERNHSLGYYKRVEYYQTVEEEADSVLKGGKINR